MVEGPLTLLEGIAVGGFPVGADHFSVHEPCQCVLGPLEGIDVPAADGHFLAEGTDGVAAMSEVVGPVAVHGVVGHFLVVNALEDIYLAPFGPTVGRRLGHHPRRREVALIEVGAQAYFHLAVGEGEAVARLHGTGDHRHIVHRAVAVGNSPAEQAAAADAGHSRGVGNPAVPRCPLTSGGLPFRGIGQGSVGLVEFVAEDELILPLLVGIVGRWRQGLGVQQEGDGTSCKKGGKKRGAT